VIEPTSWKCDALGAGAGFAKKSRILAWAQQTFGYTGDCPKCHALGDKNCDAPTRAHDEADSLGVVTCATIRWCRDRALR
jgi:hypothetical protein